jgi:hypothetical protein
MTVSNGEASSCAGTPRAQAALKILAPSRCVAMSRSRANARTGSSEARGCATPPETIGVFSIAKSAVSAT